MPVIAVPNVAAGSAQQAADAASAASRQTLTPAIITVEVIGYGGDEQGAPDQKRKPQAGQTSSP